MMQELGGRVEGGKILVAAAQPSLDVPMSRQMVRSIC